METRYTLAARVNTWPLDVNAPSPRYLVEVGTERQFEITAGVHRVLELLRDEELTLSEIAARLSSDGSETATLEKISWLVDSVLLPRRIVTAVPAGDAAAGDPAPEEPAAPLPRRSSYLWLRVPLLAPQTVAPLTRWLSALYHPRLAVPILALAAATYLYFFTVVLPGFSWRLSDLPASQTVLLLVALNLTTIFHELGHVSACRYFGAPHGKIGWGIYLYMFVLYADVTPVWRLRRWQRAVVDVGGMYFEVIASLVLFGLFLLTAEPFFVYCLLFLLLKIALSLNPILRQDGYWLLADLIGQPNLRDANLAVLRHGVRRLAGRREELPPALKGKPGWLLATLVAHSVASLAFSVYLLAWMARRMVVEDFPAMGQKAREIALLLAPASTDWWAVLAASGRFALHGVFVLILGFAAWSFLASVVLPLVGRHRKSFATATAARVEWREST